MLNSILETRKANGNHASITLEIHDEEYFSVYEGLMEDDAFELLENYLKYRADDGRPEDIKLKHDKTDHTIVINADLFYTGNEKTEDMYHTHDSLRYDRH